MRAELTESKLWQARPCPAIWRAGRMAGMDHNPYAPSMVAIEREPERPCYAPLDQKIRALTLFWSFVIIALASFLQIVVR